MSGPCLAIFPLSVSSTIDGTLLGEGGVVLVDGGDEVVGNHLTLSREPYGASKSLAEVAVVLNGEPLAPT